MDALSKSIYNLTTIQKFLLRKSVKDINEPHEILSWKPWCTIIGDLLQQLRLTTADPDDGAPTVVTKPAGAGGRFDDDAADAELGLITDAPSSSTGQTPTPTAILESATRLTKLLTYFALEPASLDATVEIL